MEENKKDQTIKAVICMIIITLLGKVMGLVRDQFLASNYSMGIEATAFLTASRIPRTFFDAVFASAVSASFIPIFTEYLEKDGKEEAFQLSNQFITWIGFVSILMIFVGLGFVPELVGLFADGFDEPTANLSEELLRILFPAIFFTGIAFSFVGILQSMDEFIIPASMSIASNGIIILYYIFFNEQYGIYGLTVAFLIGWFMQALIQIPPLWKKGYRYRFDLRFKSDGMKKIGLLAMPVMVSTWIQPINIVINSRFASHLLEGAGVTVIEYANTVYSIIVGILVLSVANVVFPKLARIQTGEQGDEFQKTISVTLEIMIFFLLPIQIGLMCLSEPLIYLIFERGAFGAYETGLTAEALYYFAIGMIGFAVQTILSRAYYAKQNGKIPLVSGILSIGANLILCTTLSPIMGVNGLALASAVASWVSAIALLLPMQQTHHILSKKLLKEFFKMTIVSLCMGFGVTQTYGYLEPTITKSFISVFGVICICTIVGGIFYGILSYVGNVGQWKFIIDMMKGKVMKK